MARGTRGDPFSDAESAVWWAANRERWRAVFFAKSPPKIEGDWNWSDLHGWVRRSNARARTKPKGGAK